MAPTPRTLRAGATVRLRPRHLVFTVCVYGQTVKTRAKARRWVRVGVDQKKLLELGALLAVECTKAGICRGRRGLFQSEGGVGGRDGCGSCVVQHETDALTTAVRNEVSTQRRQKSFA